MNRILVRKNVEGSPVVIGLQRRALNGGYEETTSTFTDDDPLTCIYWAGGDLPPIGELPCIWVDPAVGSVRVSFPANAWQGLEPGIYSAVVRLGTTPPVDLAFFELELEASPANGAARPVYIAASDLAEEYPGLESLVGSVDVDQSGFANLRADARDWLDNNILSHYRRPTCAADVGPYQFYVPWMDAPETNVWLADALENGCLLQWTPNGRRLRKAQAYWVLAKVFRRMAVLNAVQAAGYLDLADYHSKQANDTLMTSVAEIDLVGDGRVSLTISFRSTVTRRR